MNKSGDERAWESWLDTAATLHAVSERTAASATLCPDVAA